MAARRLVVVGLLCLMAACRFDAGILAFSLSPRVNVTSGVMVGEAFATATITPTITSTWTPTATPTLTPSPTATRTPTSSPTPVLTLEGVVFFDQNANGTWEESEPGLSGVILEAGGVKTVTGQKGEYLFAGLSPGKLAVSVSAPGYRFLTSGQAGLQMLSRPLDLAASGSLTLDIGLAQGMLTLPFRCCPCYTRHTPFGLTGMVDLDRRSGYMRSYDPHKVKPLHLSQYIPPWIYDQHDGLDFSVPVGTEVVAAAPGVVKLIGFEYYGVGHYIILHHLANNTQTLYGHLSQVLVRKEQVVPRGQVIGMSGNTGYSTEPHLHFRHASWDAVTHPIDPFRDLNAPTSVSAWTVDNDPRYP